ncbi:putative methyltransferase DDB_G0268948 [Physella acuta]|uniref:putative methyltransferase DDB_G0268948 n=1 Tax=Physella acuta TaxID=109671 RepID=UPI0027DE6ACD|nr:putative methyltransferase DDB_G0268948 [Physella acuta]
MLKESEKLLQSLHTGKTFAKMYAAFRPSYPQEVYDKIMSYHLERPGSPPCDQQLAVDVCCGTGQSTLPLTKYFGKVTGVDISEDQVREMPTDVKNLKAVVSSAEDLYFLESGSVHLVTIATSLHWVNRDKFFDEARRVLKPGGTFVAYSYWFDQLANNEAETFMKKMLHTVFGKYLTSRLDVMENKYATIKFPFSHIKRYDGIKIPAEMTLKEYIGYIASFHYINLYLRDFPKSNILEEIEKSLALILGSRNGDPDDTINVKTEWNVFMVLGRRE